MIQRYSALAILALALAACLDRNYDNPFSESGSEVSDEWKRDGNGNGVSDSLDRYAPDCKDSPKECLRRALAAAETARNAAETARNDAAKPGKGQAGDDPAHPQGPGKPSQDSAKPADPINAPKDSIPPTDPIKPPKDSVKPADPVKPPADSLPPVKPPVIPRDTVRDTIVVVPPRDTVRDTVVIVPSPVSVTGIQAAPIHIPMGAAKATPSVTVLPHDAKNRGYALVSLDEGIVKVSGLDLVPVKPGTAKVRARSDEGGFTAEFDAIVFLKDTNVYEEKVSVADMELTVGDPARFPDILWTPSNVGNRGYSLASSNPAAVSVVSEGGTARCKAVAPGSATMTLTTQGKGLVAVFKVTSKAAPLLSVPVLAIAADDMFLDLDAADVSPAVRFTPMLATNKAYTLSSDKPGIVSVSGTSLHAVSGGEARITLTSADGPSSHFKVVVRVHVASVSAPDIILDSGETAVPAALILPSDATDKTYTLSSDKPKFVSVQGTGIRAEKKGNAIITITASDGGITGTFKVTVGRTGGGGDD
jgi:uncharacterized protein YjdB